jgi:hypothetical protein
VRAEEADVAEARGAWDVHVVEAAVGEMGVVNEVAEMARDLADRISH